jgi:hypothetical protein
MSVTPQRRDNHRQLLDARGSSHARPDEIIEEGVAGVREGVASHAWHKRLISMLETGKTPRSIALGPPVDGMTAARDAFRATIGPEAFRGMVIWEIPFKAGLAEFWPGLQTEECRGSLRDLNPLFSPVDYFVHTGMLPHLNGWSGTK